ncbi:SAM-dependent methyltransferase [Hazenella sp. IB182357]|uniref:SAM-dependent methyltransferase n=1 Tax=Polycladospora coralii TaxID=2771432 RepID=A0A926RTH9_9BACL|nr:SAM-dependent methyltransferase [Polycladospora coralii]MBS7530131.1 SAM-dependent methyltransferase [Polycladospora coralii]
MEEQYVISDRLKTIASYIPEHKRVADIGGDHALLLMYLAKRHQLQHGIVGELNEGPFQNAKTRVQAFQCDSLIDVRLGNGLSILSPHEVDVVVIAGMGGNLITQILEEGKPSLIGVHTLILQPNISSGLIRKWLVKNGFRIHQETIVKENDILYEIIVAIQETSDEIKPEILYDMGPMLWKERHPLLREKIEYEINSRKRVLNQLEKGKTAQAISRRQQIQNELYQWEEALTCL